MEEDFCPIGECRKHRYIGRLGSGCESMKRGLHGAKNADKERSYKV